VNSSGSWTREEVYVGGRHLATYSGTTTYFHNADWLGTERVRTDVNGNIYETCQGLPYGDGQACVGTEVTPMHLTGKHRDTETNLDDFPARYYSSVQGRWLSPDWDDKPVAVPYAILGNPQTLNLYSYVGGDPTNHADPDGHMNLNALSTANTASWEDYYEDQRGQATSVLYDAVGTGQNQKTLDETAMAAEKKALRLTRAALKEGRHVEYGGWIVRSNRDGSLSYTKPAKGEEGEIDMDKIPVPKGASVVAEYHTHPHTTSAEGEGADAGDVNHLRYVAATEHVDRPGYVADTYSGNVYRYTQWEPIKGLFDTRTFGTMIGNVPPD